jgi:hypothetical protein
VESANLLCAEAAGLILSLGERLSDWSVNRRRGLNRHWLFFFGVSKGSHDEMFGFSQGVEVNPLMGEVCALLK